MSRSKTGNGFRPGKSGDCALIAVGEKNKNVFESSRSKGSGKNEIQKAKKIMSKCLINSFGFAALKVSRESRETLSTQHWPTGKTAVGRTLCEPQPRRSQAPRRLPGTGQPKLNCDSQFAHLNNLIEAVRLLAQI